MKKTIIFKLLAVTIILGLFSCEEHKIKYDGPWFVHFGQSSYNFPIAGTVEVPIFLTAPLQPNDVTATISITSDDLVEGVDYTVDKKEITFKAGTLSDTITFTGLDTDIPKGLTVSLSISSVSGNFETVNSEQSFATLNAIPNFLVVHKSLNLTVDQATGWEGLDLIENGTNSSTGIWNTNHADWGGTWHIFAEMHGKDVIATRNGNYVELTPLEADVLIGPDNTGWIGDYGWSSDWHQIPLLSSDSYLAWRDRTAYVGAKMFGANGIVNYAWLKYSVNVNGTVATLVEYAYEATGKALKTGQTE